MKKISLRLAAIGTAAVLVATSLTIKMQPANAGGEEFWGAVLGGVIGGALSGNVNQGGRRNYSSKEVREAGEKMLISNGLTPLDECTVSAVSVTIGSEEVCAIPNPSLGIGPGTYRVHPDTFALIPYGITAKTNGYPNQTPTNIYNPGYPNQTPVNVNNSPQIINAVNQSSSSFAANGSIYSLSGQQISPPILAKLRSLLAGNNIAEAACGTTSQQVTITVNNEFVICGHPNNKYTPGNYNLTLNGLY